MVQILNTNTPGQSILQDTSLNGQPSDISEVRAHGSIAAESTRIPLSSELQRPPGFTRALVQSKRTRENGIKDEYIYKLEKRRKKYDQLYSTVKTKFEEMHKKCGAWIILYSRR
jgi:hypothetical protein